MFLMMSLSLSKRKKRPYVSSEQLTSEAKCSRGARIYSQVNACKLSSMQKKVHPKCKSKCHIHPLLEKFGSSLQAGAVELLVR